MASNCPDCRLANLDRWTGEMALPRELGALDGPVFSDVSFEGSAIIRAGGGDTPVAASHTRYGTARWILILCAWTIVGLLFAVRRIVLVKVQVASYAFHTPGSGLRSPPLRSALSRLDSPRDLIVKEHGLANPLPTGKLTNGLDQEEETQAFGVSSGRRRIGRSASPGRIVAK